MTETLTETEEREDYQPPYQVYAVADWGSFEAKFEKLLKRAAKLGVEPPTYVVLAEQQQFIYDWRDRDVAGTGILAPTTTLDDIEKARQFREDAYRNARPITVRLIALEGGTPKLAGWEFVATLQHAGEAGNILRTVPTFEGTLPDEFRHTSPERCDQCRKSIYRIATYIVRNEDGRWAQVGSTCIADFLGGVSPEAIARWTETFAAFELPGGEDDEDWWGSGYGEDEDGIEHFLALTAAIIARDGWVSGRLARERGGSSTAETVWAETLKRTRSKYDPPPVVLTTDHYREAEEALTWVRDLEPEEYGSNDFLWNLHVATATDRVTWKTKGLVAAVYVARKFALEREEERRAREERQAAEREGQAASEFFGQEKERLEFTARVVLTLPVESFYGTSVLTKFVTDEGNVAIWFDSGSKDQFQEGGRYRIKATVTGHEEREGVKQTKVNRAVALETLEEPPEEEDDDDGTTTT